MKCAINGCFNLRADKPEKYFFCSPRSLPLKELWMKPTGRMFSPKTTFMVCEDHFDLRKDVNFYKLNGAPSLKTSAFPNRNLEESDMKLQAIIDTITWSCFVPNCESKKLMTKNKIIFFPVPEGEEGVLWKSAVRGGLPYNVSSNDLVEFCCEKHFDIDKDIEKKFHSNTSVEFTIKTGVVPLIRLNAMDISNETEQSNIADTVIHPRMILNNHVSYLYNSKLLLKVEELQRTANLINENYIKIESDSVNLTEMKVESHLEEETFIKTEPIDLGYDVESEYNGLVVKTEEIEFDDYQLDSKSNCKYGFESEHESASEAYRKIKEEPDVSIDDFSIKSYDLISSEYSIHSDESVCSEDSFHSETSRNYKESECPYCRDLVRNLKSHIDRVHLTFAKNVNKTFCGLCGLKFEFKQDSKVHQEKLHNGNGYACDLCDFMTPVFHRLKRHIIDIHSSSPDCLCHICGNTFQFMEELTWHMERKHFRRRKRNHLCHICGNTYRFMENLSRHLEEKHFRERNYACLMCDETYFAAQSLRLHIQSCHIKELSFHCNVVATKPLVEIVLPPTGACEAAVSCMRNIRKNVLPIGIRKRI